MIKSKIILCVLILFCSAVTVFAEYIKTDNDYLQEYKGQSGRWIHVSSLKDLKNQIARFGSSFEQVKDVNSNFGFNRYLFIPFSDEIVHEIENSHNGRSESLCGESGFIWPLNNVERVSSAFGMRNGSLHGAIDLPANKGTPIVAARDGRVVYAQYDPGYGKLICLEHRDYYFTKYSHNSEVFVKKGDFVKKGQIIGLVGSTGHSTGNHLHFEIRFKDIPLNPMDFLPDDKDLSCPHGFIRNWK
ncbi:MAG TPA: M23 family metallopeptidase [Spirochaetota bacterium]|nr:M23 family metallopeptidase [Spirochaetota bacterium]HPI88093.1 M23 family metallopeptidase [Spirochaetota bacterium]HPR46422.1 M23 family metallopeptidase [Spirochaetota bacterium]